MIHVFGVLLNSKINKVMARKKKVEEEQPVAAEVVRLKRNLQRKHQRPKCLFKKKAYRKPLFKSRCQRRKYERFF